MKRKVLLIVITAFVSLALIPFAASNWSTPVNVSKTSASSTNPQMAVDSEDNVYIVWSEVLGVKDHRIKYDLFYSCKEETNPWSKPASFFGRKGPKESQFCLTMDKKDTLYLIWREHMKSWVVAGKRVYEPEGIPQGDLRMDIDDEGRVTQVGNVFFSTKTKGGDWSKPQLLFPRKAERSVGHGATWSTEISDLASWRVTFDKENHLHMTLPVHIQMILHDKENNKLAFSGRPYLWITKNGNNEWTASFFPRALTKKEQKTLLAAYEPLKGLKGGEYLLTEEHLPFAAQAGSDKLGKATKKFKTEPLHTLNLIREMMRVTYTFYLGVDNANTLHLVCGDQIFPTDDTWLYLAKPENGDWSDPIEVLSDRHGAGLEHPHIVLDSEGNLRFVWDCVWKKRGLFYAVKPKGGRLSEPARLFEPEPSTLHSGFGQRLNWEGRGSSLAIDENDTLHLVWTEIEMEPPAMEDIGSYRVMYAFKPKNGQWSTPATIAKTDRFQPLDSPVIVVGKERIHVAWVRTTRGVEEIAPGRAVGSKNEEIYYCELRL